jgi:LysR family transcriptional activator of nhaA
MQLVVGVANAVPKLVVYRLLRPALIGPDRVHLVCREERTEQLLAQLATHALDVVIADAPAPPHIRVKVFSHLLGESDMGFYAPKALATRIRRRFPASLHEVPMLLPTSTTPLRRELDTWFDRQGVRPLIVGEFDDTALMKAFGRGAGAVFPAPAAIGAEVGKLYGVTSCGRTHDVRERYYVISAERRLTHPTVLALTSAAREGIFG